MGGMSTVFEAEAGDGQHVALKLLHSSLSVDSSGRERLRREVRMLQQVKGSYVAEVLDAETDDDDAFIVTELIDGPTLERDVVDNGVFTGEDLVDLACQLREAVESIHRVGVLHRDIKPSNVMMSRTGPVLIDFGVAQFDDDVRLTVPGSLTHTPGYCDPKVLAGAPPDEEADWWALTAVLAYAATGDHPFGLGAPAAIMRRVIDGVADLEGLSPEWTAAFSCALSPNVRERISFDQLIRVLAGESSAEEEAKTALLTSPGVMGAGAGLGVGSGGGVGVGTNAGAGVTEVFPSDGFAPAGDSGRTEILVPDDGATQVLSEPGDTVPNSPEEAAPTAPHEAETARYGEPYGAKTAQYGAETAAYGPNMAPASPSAVPTAIVPEPVPNQPLPAPVYPAQQAPQFPGRAGHPASPAQAGYPSAAGQAGYPAQPAFPGQPASPVQQSFPGHEGFAGQPAPSPNLPPIQGGQGFPGFPVPETIPVWARPAPPARLIVALAGSIVVALGARWPLAAGALCLAMMWCAGAVGYAAAGLLQRRMSHGGHYKGERAGLLVRLPWSIVWAGGAAVLNAAVGVFFGVALMWVGTLLQIGTPWMVVAAGVGVAVVATWLMGTNATARDGARQIVRGIAPAMSYRIFWALFLLVVLGVAVAIALAGGGTVDWAPIPEPFFMRAP